MYNPFTLDGKTILITGASSGIGRSVAIECSKMGAVVIITARNEQRLSETFESLSRDNEQQHHMILADLSSDDGVFHLVDDCPKLDGAVLAAGIGMTALLKQATPSRFRKAFDTNFFSAAETVRLLYKSKKIVNGASIVLVSSVGGNFVYEIGGVAYGTSKAALTSFTKFAAKEFAAKKIRVNCICPGMVDTPLIHRGVYTEEQLEEYKKNYPLGRFGTPCDIALSAVWILSEATSWLTGQAIVLDGGASI